MDDMSIHMKRISRLPFPICKGLNSFQLKIIALIFMTLGHSVMFLKTIIPFLMTMKTSSLPFAGFLHSCFYI